jgi:lipid-binding SYLF domain-containing protein
MLSLKQRAVAALAVAFFALFAALPARAQGVGMEPRRYRTADATRHSNDAASVLRKIMTVPEKSIPRDLLEGAEAVAVCPGVYKAAFIFGGRKGDCVISRRTLKREWGAPVFYNLTGASVGLQVGGSKTDYVLLFMNAEALSGLMKDKFEVGGEVEVAAGPVGRAAGASTNPRLSAGILTYSRSKGAFIGVSLKGVAFTPDNDLNEAFYGRKASELMRGQEDTPVPTQVRALPLALARYSVRLPN